MRAFFSVVMTLVVICLAYWAYKENYATQQAAKEVRELQNQIAHHRDSLVALRAEWAYLNRPDRLRALVDINYDRLELLTLTPDQFGRVDQVAYPAEPSLSVFQTGMRTMSTQGEEG